MTSGRRWDPACGREWIGTGAQMRAAVESVEKAQAHVSQELRAFTPFQILSEEFRAPEKVRDLFANCLKCAYFACWCGIQ
jgi:hypothetical protein